MNARFAVRSMFFGGCLFLLLISHAAFAYERDVHYGLTYWLALRAGFDHSQAEAIAVGDQRVDSGGPQTIDVLLDYACVDRREAPARQYARRHFPGGAALPAEQSARAVEPDSAAVQKGVVDAIAAAKGQEGASLSLFGGALHSMQDSWSHRGIPDTPQPGAGISCDPTLASGHPKTRGGASSHEADQTHVYPADVLDMARATYQSLLRYPDIGGKARSPAAWETLEPMVAKFAQAKTKAEKREWFHAQQIASTGFLQGITLADGGDAEPSKFENPLMPKLQGMKSFQLNMPPEATAFFEGFLERWLSDVAVEKLVAGDRPPSRKAGKDRKSEQLIARLKVWRIRDHGAVAKLAHKSGDYTPAELKAINKLSGTTAQIVPATVGEALEGLTDSNQKASALLPFLLRQLPDGPGGSARMLAMTRLKHAPYDTVGWIAEKSESGWKLTGVVAVVEH